jgi:stringent starvation protein B
MQSTKPYLIRALHEWCIDQGFTPYLSVVVDAMTRAPAEFIKNGEIVFNIGLDATNQLQLGNDEITFQGRFSGKVFPVIVPIARVAAIYARESSEGMAFEVTESVLPTLPADSATTLKTKPPMLSSVEREPAAKGKTRKTRRVLRRRKIWKVAQLIHHLPNHLPHLIARHSRESSKQNCKRAGALEQNRTADLPLRRRSLYPLSYEGAPRILTVHL